MNLFDRLRGRRDVDRDLADELGAHLEARIEELVEAGVPAEKAGQQARRELGNAVLLTERGRDVWRFAIIEDAWQDVRYAWRHLRRAPAFAAAVILTLALGIGASTAIFTVVHAVLLRSLPYPGADRFVRLALQFEATDGSGTKTFAATPSFEDVEFLRSRARTVSNLGTYQPATVTLSRRGEAAHLSGARISPQVMAMLGATPLMGRLLDPREELSGRERVVVASYALWQRRLGGDAAVLGQTLVLDGIAYEIVGVMRPGFHFPNADTEFWTPFVWSPRAQPVVVGRTNAGISFVTASNEVNDLLQFLRQERRRAANSPPSATLPPSAGGPPPPGPPPPPPPPSRAPPPSSGSPPPQGLSDGPRRGGPPPQAPSEDPPGPNVGPRRGSPPPPGPSDGPRRGSSPAEATDRGPRNGAPNGTAFDAPRYLVVGLQNELVADVRRPLVIVTSAVGFVLLIACVNVGSLLLARGLKREQEIAVRLALGAGRSRVVRQLVTESMLLTLVGGATGVWLAIAGVRWLRTFGAAMPRQDLAATSIVPRLDEVGVDGTALLFSLAVSVVAGLACSLGPALWQSRADTRAALSRETTSSAPGVSLFRASRGRAALIVLQISLAVVLLLSSGLLIRSFLKLSSVNPGYATTSVVTFQVALPPNQSAERFSAELVARMQALPGVRAAGYTDHLPLARSNLGHAFISTRPQSSASMVPPPPPPPGTPGKPEFPVAHVVSRDFLTALGIAVVEGRGFSDTDPAGRPHSLLINRSLARSGFLGEHPVGTRIYTDGDVPWDIVGVVEDFRETGLADPPGPEMFVGAETSDAIDTMFGFSSPYFAVGTNGSPAAFMSAIRDVVRQVDSRTTPDRIATMDDIVANSILQPRFYAGVFGLFAIIAGTLAVVGIYGGIAFAVRRRTREIGIRVALGASSLQVLQTVVGDALVLAAAGIAAGVTGGVLLTRYMERMLFDLTPLDSTVFVTTPAVFAAVVLGAALLAARPALTVAPLAALRHE